VSKARQLIGLLEAGDPMARRRAWNVMFRAGLHSSSHRNYGTQEDEWAEVAKEMGLSMAELPNYLLQVFDGAFSGLEGLWEITKSPALWPLTDYAHAGETDQYVVSYFYGSDQRRQQWEKHVGRDPKKLAGSFAAATNGQRIGGNMVAWDPARGNGQFTRAEIKKGLDKMISLGIPIQMKHAEGGMVVFGEGTVRDSIAKLLGGEE
jgi:hypothetical protein